MEKGIFSGAGVGPGDPGLITIGALKAIEDADILMLPASDRKSCRAYHTAEAASPLVKDKECMFEPFPMKMDRDELVKFHKTVAVKVEEKLDEGRNVVFLTIGDPSVYSTFDYIEKIVKDDGYKTERISGIPSFVAAAGRLDISLGEDGRPIHIIPGSMDIKEALKLEGTKVFMKNGKNLALLKNELIRYERETKCRVCGAYMCTLPDEQLIYKAQDIPDDWGYLNVLIVD